MRSSKRVCSRPFCACPLAHSGVPRNGQHVRGGRICKKSFSTYDVTSIRRINPSLDSVCRRKYATILCLIVNRSRKISSACYDIRITVIDLVLNFYNSFYYSKGDYVALMKICKLHRFRHRCTYEPCRDRRAMQWAVLLNINPYYLASSLDATVLNIFKLYNLLRLTLKARYKSDDTLIFLSFSHPSMFFQLK